MRRLIFALILLAAIIFIISNFGSFQNFAAVLQMGNPVWIGLAFIVQGTWLLNVSAQYRTALRTVGIERNMRDLFVLMLGSNFLNVVAPSGGVSGMALFLDDARRRGIGEAYRDRWLGQLERIGEGRRHRGELGGIPLLSGAFATR